MINSDKDIKKLIAGKKLVFKPVLTEDQIGPASIDLKLANIIKFFQIKKHSLLDIKKEMPADLIETYKVKNGEPFILHPGDFILASTEEYVKVPDDIVIRVEGKSSLGRMGIMVHTAGFVDPGFEGNITLQISNQSNIAVAIYPGMYICQIAIEPLSSPAENPYNKRVKSLYHKSKGPVSSKTRNLI